MSDAIVLDKPEQINMWVLISRRHQLQMQMHGLKTPGIVKWCNANVPGCETARTAKACVVPVEFAISQAGGEVDYKVVNVRALVNRGGLMFDKGVFPDMSTIETTRPDLVSEYAKGSLELVLTLDDVCDGTNEIMVPA